MPFDSLLYEEQFQDLRESEVKLELRGLKTTKFYTEKSTESFNTTQLGQDMWNQLEHVSIP